MLLLFLISLALAAVGTLPLLIYKHWKPAAGLAAVFAVVSWIVFYFMKASTAAPFFGAFGTALSIELVLSVAVLIALDRSKQRFAAIPLVLMLMYGARACTGCAMFRADDYAGMIGRVEERAWADDVQPADPKHIRLVPEELAVWLANKQLGSLGTIGSRFELGNFTLQLIKGELWYVAPLDFSGLRAWWSADVTPGYLMVNAEDPNSAVVVKSDAHFRYTPGAYFGKNLERHLLENGFRSKGLMDPSLEIDEDGKPWWVVTVYEPAIAWTGEKILGVAVVDPVTGDSTYHPVGATPEWIDRVFPASTIHRYIAWWGEYRGGWWNSWLGKKDLVEPEDTHLVYGADGRPKWVTPVTSPNKKDASMIGVFYTDVHTGTSVLYRTGGGTDAAIRQAVNNKVAYKKWHSSSPVLYNIRGTMSAVVPILGENHTFQSVAIVSVTDPQRVGVGTTFDEALRAYEHEITKAGSGTLLDASHANKSLEATVGRIGTEPREGGGVTYLLLFGSDARIFAAASGVSHELPLTQPGDIVTFTYIESRESIVTLTSFDNLAIGPPEQPPAPAPAPAAAPPAEPQH